MSKTSVVATQGGILSPTPDELWGSGSAATELGGGANSSPVAAVIG